MNRTVQDKANADCESLVAKSKQWLVRKYGTNTLEYWYTDITLRIIVKE